MSITYRTSCKRFLLSEATLELGWDCCRIARDPEHCHRGARGGSESQTARRESEEGPAVEGALRAAGKATNSTLGAATREAGICATAGGSGREAGEMGRKRRVSARALAITTANIDRKRKPLFAEPPT